MKGAEFKLSGKARTRLLEIKRCYPAAQSAVMPALYLVQEECGCIPEPAVVWLAEQLQLPAVRIRELVTFYTLYRQKPLGRYHVQVCGTLSCAVSGAAGLADYLAQRLAVGPKEVTPNGMWSYETVQCLGSCGTGPVAQINDTYFERLTGEAGGAMDRIEAEQLT